MPDYEDIIAAAIEGDEAPRRTKRGALKYQPADTDWSLDRLPELQDFYQSTYKRPLPVTVKGQGSVHNRLGYDHRASADISLNPTTKEGQEFMAELQKRRVPFLAFDRAIPGASTGPHIHLGRASSRTTARYGVGQQVKGQRKPAQPDSYDDIIAAATGQQPAKPAPKPATPPLDPLLHQLGRINDASDPGQPAGMGEFRRAEAAEQRQQADTGMGRLRQLDEPALAERRSVEAEVRRQRKAGGTIPGAATLARGLSYGIQNPYAAVADLLAGRTEEESISQEVDRRLQGSYEERQRIREISQQFTAEDRRQLTTAIERMRGQGSVSRGIETGSQRVGSGLLYKLASLADIMVQPATTLPGQGRSQLGDYLRRQAGRGELALAEIEAEMPPDLAQQFADFATHAVGALPEIFGATAVAGPVGGFAALGGLEAAGRKQPFSEVARETVKGAALGAVFKGAGAVEIGGPARTFGQRTADTARSSAAIGLGTVAVEKAFGATDYDAARSAVSNVLLHVGMRAPGEIAKLTTAAERALTKPDANDPVPTVPLDLQTRLARAEAERPADTAPIEAELKTPTAPPAEVTPQPPTTAKPAVDVAATTPAAPSKPALADLMRERMEAGPAEPVRTGPDLELVEPTTPAGSWRVRARQGDGSLKTEKFKTEAEAVDRMAELAADSAILTKGEPIDLGEVDAGPINALTGKPVSRRPSTEGEEGGFNLRALFGRKSEPETPEGRAQSLREQMDREEEAVHAKHQADMAAERGVEPFLSKPRTVEEAGKRYGELASRMIYLNTRIGDAGGPRRPLPKAEVDALREQHSTTWREAREIEEYIQGQGYKVNMLGETARPNEPFPSNRREGGEGGFVDLTEVIAGLNELRGKFPGRSERELRSMLPPQHRELLDREQPLHPSTAQPRTDTGQFAPGLPGGPEAARADLRREARKYREQYQALDRHPARREGLDITNDEAARNYFSQLHRMAAEFTPKQAAAVDRAESLYNQGRYDQATMLAESVFRSLPDKVNEYSAADAAIQLLTEHNITPKANWAKVLQEVRERIKRTGPLSGGGSTFYDVNKYPEGGRPDHSKIAYILEPVVDALKMDAQRLIAEGKLKAADYVAHVRKSVNEMLAREEFADWHPLNKSAAMGVLVDKLRQEGPPAGTPPAGPTAEAPQPAQRQRSLPKTLEKSGRDPGTNLTYDRLPNRQVNERVEARLEAEGAEALEAWYRSAPESADRTAAHRVLVDHYTFEAVRLAETAPQQAQNLLAHARELSNLEAERATTIGQAMQMYSNLLKYTPAGVMREIARLARQGVEVTTEQIHRLTEAAHQADRADREVRRLERELVEAEGTEAPEPVEVAATPTVGTAATRRARRQSGRTTTEPEGATGGPRRYRPRPGAPDTPAERVRRQLDEAAQRRRAQRAAIAAQLRQLEQQQTLSGYWRRSMNITRGLMVSAFSTAMRNLQSQALRFDIERLDDLVEHTIRRSIGLDSDLTYRNIWRNTARQFKFSQTAEAREILSAHEGEYHRMFNTYAGGVEVPIPHPTRARVERVFQTTERAVEIANYFNRVQEFHVRSAEFLAELDLHLRKEHNQTLEQYVRRNGIDAIPLELVRRATDKALEVTFADMPARDGAGGRFIGSMIELGNYLPPTMSPVAFPRFMYNNLKFLYQHSPAGMLDLARKGQNKPRVIARSLVGTSMLLLAYQFRSSDHAGEKWYELKFGDTTLDARPFGPFSTYLFLAEGIRRSLNGEKQFTKDEVAQALGASVLGSGVGFALVDKVWNQLSNGEWEKLQRTLKTEGGEWGRALLTPVRQVKDLIAAFDESQAVSRDTSETPFLGPMRESIPYASTDLPEAHRAETATPIRQERPATKAITGWRVQTPKTFLQRQLDELNFQFNEILPSTGNPTLDALQKRLMGPMMDDLSKELENDAEFKAMTKKARSAYLRELLSDIREEVRDAAEAEQPELIEQNKEERKPRRQREFEQELNSPGLSRALELGVPMPIPPRRPGEDDISYRARLLQVGRQRNTQLDGVIGELHGLPIAQQRSRLHAALYRG